MGIQVLTLDNGLSIIHKQVPHTQVVHCGFVVNAGSRDENEAEEGMAHFLEHMVFKGTERRKTFHILNYLDSLGGELNAYTTKEKTCLYASISSEYFERALELLTDITFRSTFPEKEIRKEKQVIAEEIDMYRDNAEEAIFEDFDELVFAGHPLAHPILGSKKSISQFDQAQLRSFVQRNYTSDRIVFAVVGNVPTKKVERLARKHLGKLDLPRGKREQAVANGFHRTQKQETRPIAQSHTILGGRAFPLRQEHYYSFYLLNNHLGGPAMNSRLNLNIREKYGLTYNIYSFYTALSDTGSWGVYFGCEPGNQKRVETLVNRELTELRDNKMTERKLNQLKKQLVGQARLSNENLLTQCLSYARHWVDFQEVFELSHAEEKVMAVTPEQIREAAEIAFAPENLSILHFAGEPQN